MFSRPPSKIDSMRFGLALMMGRLVVLWPFCGLSSKQARVFICRTFFVMVHVGLALSFGPS